jgi:hypothetical protein
MEPVTRIETTYNNRHDDSVTWTEIKESLTRDGVTFERYGNQYQNSSEPVDLGHFAARDDRSIHPGILCGDCQGDAFTLHYGLYEIKARCVACGKQSTVYDG